MAKRALLKFRGTVNPTFSIYPQPYNWLSWKVWFRHIIWHISGAFYDDKESEIVWTLMGIVWVCSCSPLKLAAKFLLTWLGAGQGPTAGEEYRDWWSKSNKRGNFMYLDVIMLPNISELQWLTTHALSLSKMQSKPTQLQTSFTAVGLNCSPGSPSIRMSAAKSQGSSVLGIIRKLICCRRTLYM